jgi:hypothetical protein
MLHSLSPSLVLFTANTIYTSVDLAPSPQFSLSFFVGEVDHTHTQSHSLTRTRSTLRRLLCSLCSLSCGLLPSSSDAGSTTGDWFIKFYAPWSVPVHVSSSSLFVCLTFSTPSTLSPSRTTSSPLRPKHLHSPTHPPHTHTGYPREGPMHPRFTVFHPSSLPV